MEDKIKKLIEEYVEADRKYQLALDEYKGGTDWKKYGEVREDIALRIADILVEKEGYFRKSTKKNNLYYWVKPGED